ncbi:MAG: GldG family protein [Proteobacteria bacterium]|nr:GldG family protein [Burkholderiales bacterium]
MATNIDRKFRLRLSAQNWLFVVLLVALAGLASYAAREYKKEWDVSLNARNTLSQPTVDMLSQLTGQVMVTSYATGQEDLRKVVRDFLAPYQRIKPDLVLSFIDPREQPKLAQSAGVQVNGEMVVEFGKRSENISTLTEQAFANLLMRLARGSDRNVMSLDGHGERVIDGGANHDLGQFGRQLENKGFATGPLNLSLAQAVPENVKILIIAGPKVDLLPPEVKKIKDWIDKGGSLLWLIDQEPLRGLQPIADIFGLVLNPGTVVDPSAQLINAAPTMAVATGYGQHPIAKNFTLNTIMPFARSIAVDDSRDWRDTPLIEVAPRGWLEMSPIGDSVTFDKGRDTPGPITVGLALERTLNDKPQRVVIIGTGHFLANQYVGLVGNMDLGINIANWLAGDDNLITVQPRATLDSSLNLSRTSMMVIIYGFLVLLPLGFLATGATIWWRRRRKA